MRMSRQVCITLAAILTVIDAGIHLRRSLLPDFNPFGSALHQQFLLFSLVALVLAVALFVGPQWLGSRGWLTSAALIVWMVGAVVVWLVAYHAPNPGGLVPDEGYVSKILEVLVALVLLPTLRPFKRTHALGSAG